MNILSDMEKIDDNFTSIFSLLKECHSRIFSLDTQIKGEYPVKKLGESLSLCSGAFYHLCLFYCKCPDLFTRPQKSNQESWNIFNKASDYQAFFSEFETPSKTVQSDFSSMCIANVAFRLSAAGELVCDVIQKIDLSECDICRCGWPYQRFFDQDRRTWNRKLLHKNGKECLELSENSSLVRNLALLIALRDEYGHSEFDEGHECRTRIRKKFYIDYIIESEIEMLRSCITTIRFLCDSYPEKLKKSENPYRVPSSSRIASYGTGIPSLR